MALGGNRKKDFLPNDRTSKTKMIRETGEFLNGPLESERMPEE